MPGSHFSPSARTGHRKFSIRGKIIKHISFSKGWWIFKNTFNGILVELNAEQLKMQEERYGKVTFLNEGSASIPGTVEIYMPDEKISSFPVDVEVGVTFAQGMRLEQFFQGAVPLAVVNVVRTSENTKLENEILPVQLSLI